LTRTQRHIIEIRQGDASIQIRDALGRPCAGIPISVEQESHAFQFGCIVPELTGYSESERNRYRARLDEVFNCVVPAELPPPADPGVRRADVTEPMPLGRLRLRLDELAAPGVAVQVQVWGAAMGLAATDNSGLDERAAGKRVAEVYMLCFAHPAVSGIFWNGFTDAEPGSGGGGLLRRDLAPKYAYRVLQKLIAFDWHSRAKGVTDATGQFRFRGFFGDYRIVADRGAVDPLVQTIAFRRGRASFMALRQGVGATATVFLCLHFCVLLHLLGMKS